MLVKTTLEIQDELLLRAKRLSKRVGKPLRALVEEGLRRVLSEQSGNVAPYELPDCSVGDPSHRDPLEAWSWQDLREEIYHERGAR